MQKDWIIGGLGVALTGALAWVAITGKTNLPSRLVVGLAALTTGRNALANLGVFE